jgi:hypothetical protein
VKPIQNIAPSMIGVDNESFGADSQDRATNMKKKPVMKQWETCEDHKFLAESTHIP